MKRIFEVDLFPPNTPDSEAYANLTLPATPYEMLDAMDKLRLKDGAVPRWEIVTYHSTNQVVLDTQGTIYELNALAQKLSELDKDQAIAYDGLLSMETGRKKDLVPISRMIDLAYSTDRCRVVTEARNDAQLGKFYVENGFIPEADGLSEKQRSLLDYERIGQARRLAEGGVFVTRAFSNTLGYVARNAGLADVNQSLDLTLRQPDYSVLLRISRGYYAPPASDCEKSVQLKLPAGQETLDAVLSSLKVKDWQETVWRGLDCRVPILTDMIYDIGVNENFDGAWIERLNSLAQKLSDMEPGTLNKYKALLSAMSCENISVAEQLVDMLDMYTFSPQYSSPTEVAKGELAVILSGPERALIESHINLYQYGAALIENCGGALTDYGLLERKDGQPVQTQEQSWRGGMEMV